MQESSKEISMLRAVFLSHFVTLFISTHSSKQA